MWEQSDSHILFPSPDAGWTQPLGLRDIWAVFLHLYYHMLYLRWHTNFSEHLFNKYLQKARFILFFLNRAYSHNTAGWGNGLGVRMVPPTRETPNYPRLRGARVSCLTYCTGLGTELLQTSGCLPHVFPCFCLKSRTVSTAQLYNSEEEKRNRKRY